VATIALIIAVTWVAITLIVLAICRAATRQDKPDEADVAESRVKAGVAAGRANADGGPGPDRPSPRE
jgi:hypothetical protein